MTLTKNLWLIMFTTLRLAVSDVLTEFNSTALDYNFSAIDISEPIVAEFYFNTDPGHGNGVPVKSTTITGWPRTIEFDVPPEMIAELPDGTHTLVCRVLDDSGNWSIAFSRPFFKEDADLIPEAQINAVEYFINTDPGQGSGTSSSISPAIWSGTLEVDVPSETIAALPAGTHTLGARVRDAHGNWSIAYARPFFKTDPEPDMQAQLAAVEYFINTDPGQGNAVSIPISPAADAGTFQVSVPAATIAALPSGTHVIAARIRDEEGNWSIAYSRPFFKDDATLGPLALMHGFELQWFHQGLPVGSTVLARADNPAKILDLAPIVPVDALENGLEYTLRVVPFDTLGRRGIGFVEPVLVNLRPEPSSPVLSGFVALPGGSLGWTLSGGAGFTWIIQTSTDLVNWTDLESIAVSEQEAQITVDGDAEPARFYRVLADISDEL